MANTRWPQALNVTVEYVGETTVLDARGVLDQSTYLALRDKIIQQALEEPRAVVVDVTELHVPAESAWLAFSSARWHVDRWPTIPLGLVCREATRCSAIADSSLAGRVPVYPTVDAAVRALGSTAASRKRRRARAELPPTLESLRRARELVMGWLTAWSLTDLIPVTKVVVTAFVENVLQHTDSMPMIRLETDGAAVIVAVADSSHRRAEICEAASMAGSPPSGLHIVSALCRAWGNAPTSSGKTVWAVIGPENRL